MCADKEGMEGEPLARELRVVVSGRPCPNQKCVWRASSSRTDPENEGGKPQQLCAITQDTGLAAQADASANANVKAGVRFG